MWVDALRSGKYRKGRNWMCSVSNKRASYCALGVLAKVLGLKFEPMEGSESRSLMGSTARLPYAVSYPIKLSNADQDWVIGLNDDRVVVPNDNRVIYNNFNKIADLIEEKL